MIIMMFIRQDLHYWKLRLDFGKLAEFFQLLKKYLVRLFLSSLGEKENDLLERCSISPNRSVQRSPVQAYILQSSLATSVYLAIVMTCFVYTSNVFVASLEKAETNGAQTYGIRYTDTHKNKDGDCTL